VGNQITCEIMDTTYPQDDNTPTSAAMEANKDDDDKINESYGRV